MPTNPFYNLQLDPEELALEKELERGDYISVDHVEKEKLQLAQAARYTLSKTKNINIRLSEKAILKLKAIAAEQGLPYQTLAASVLHKFTNDWRLG